MAINKARLQSRARVVFLAPPAWSIVANVWVLDGTAAETPAITLMHDYGKDLQPVPGWHVRIGSATYEVAAVNGLELQLTLLPEVVHG